MSRQKVGMARTCHIQNQADRPVYSGGASPVSKSQQFPLLTVIDSQHNNARAKMPTLRDARDLASDRQFGDFPRCLPQHITTQIQVRLTGVL